jgi:tRNA threonylcarbamoyladenosine biosynthesis protein TsaB
MDGLQLVWELSMHHGRDLSQKLIPALQQMMMITGGSLGDVDAVGVSVGPGSFTGLRVGVTVAKTLAYSLGVPLAAVSTLHALAEGSRARGSDLIVALLDARRRQLFAAAFARYSDGLHRLQPDTIVDLEDLPAFVRGAIGSYEAILGGPSPPRTADPLWAPTAHRFKVGSGALALVGGCSLALLGDLSEDSLGCVTVAAYPQARDVAGIAHDLLSRRETIDPAQLTPAYIRRSYAEEKAGE